MNNQEVISFVEEYFIKFMCGDIEKGIQAKANFLVALALLSYTEVFGGFISGDYGRRDRNKANFERGIERFKFLDRPDYYSSFRVRYKNNLNQQNFEDMSIYEMFRCGFVHEYFSKGLCLVHNNPDVMHWIVEDSGIGWMNDECGHRRLRFHTNAYYRDFRKALDSWINELQGNNTDLVNNAIKAIQVLKDRRIEEI